MNKVSAVIVNWNGKDVLVDCIKSLLEQDYPDLEIIVSDNGSTDGSNACVREKFPSVRIIENGRNLGFGAAVNRGLALASGNYFIFLNNDLYLRQDSIGELARLLDADSTIAAAVPKILYYEKRDTINSFGVLVNYSGIACPNLVDCRDSDTLRPHETACGGIFMFRRETYDVTGGFDENLFLYHEDHDLSWQIRLLGKKIMATPKAVIYHHYHFHKGTGKFHSSEKNRLHILIKNMEWKTLCLIFPALVMVECAQLAHSLANGWFMLKIKSYFELLALLPRILKKRGEVQRRRRVSDSEIVRLYQGTLAVSGVKHPLLDNILSPILNIWWNIIRSWI